MVIEKKKRNTEVRDWRSLNANKWSSGLASMLFWCLDLPVSSPTLAVSGMVSSFVKREWIGIGATPNCLISRFVSLSIPRQGARSNSWYPFTWLGACWTIPAPRATSSRGLAGDEVGSPGRLFNLPMFSWLIAVCICLSRRWLPRYYGYTVWNAMRDRCEGELTPRVIDDIKGDHVCD